MARYLIFFFLFLSLTALGQSEKGYLAIKNFGQEDFNSQVQNFFVTQNKEGVVYVGNKEGVLEYRGGVWMKHPLSNANDARCIFIDKNGIIYVGGLNEFGYFNSDTIQDEDLVSQRLTYYSFTGFIDSTINTGLFLSIDRKDKNIYFLAQNYLFVWDGKKLTTIHSVNNFHSFINDGKNLYVTVDKYGLQRIEGTKLINVRGCDKILYEKTGGNVGIGGKKVALKVPALSDYIKYKNGWFLGFSSKMGAYLFRIKNDVFHKKSYRFNSSFAHGKNISDFIKISDDIYAFSTLDQGILLTNSHGEILRRIDNNSGLKNNKINALYFDKQNQLWAAGEQGISRIKLNDGSQKFIPDKSGYSGTIEYITRFEGKLYVCSADGLFRLEQAKQAGDLSKFVKIDDSLVNKGCYWLTVFKSGDSERMLIITDDGISEMDENGKFSLITTGFIWSIYIDKKDPNRVWAGLDNGLASIYFNGKDFDVEGRVPGIKVRCQFIEQDKKGTIWCSNVFSDVVSLSNVEFEDHKIKNFDLKIYNEKDGLPEDNAIYPKEIWGQMVFATGEGLYRFNPGTKRFEPDDIIKGFFSVKGHKGPQTHRIYEDNEHNVWIVSKNEDETRLRVFEVSKNNDDVRIKKVYESKGKGDIFNALYEDGNSIMWFGGVNSLVKYDEKVKSDSIPLFFSYIYQVIAGNDTVFTGYENIDGQLYCSQQPEDNQVIEYKDNKLVFKYASLMRNNEEPILYSYYLEGFENVWSKWSTRGEERFTNLQEGDYVFRLRAMDRFGNISDEATYRFTVNPPWYRTIWAYIGYVLFFIAFVWGAINVSTRSLKKIIREATAEIQAQKDELEEKNQNILDSIRYAKRIQEAVTPSESQMQKFFPEHFVLWRPRDIVSGDFYWMMHKNNKVIIAAADCTGHGVPGAFMSIMGISFLNQIANIPEVQTAADALNHLRHNVITSLNQEGSETDTKDGMDISLCVYDFDEMIMEFAGAYNPLYMIRDGELSVIKADRMPVGVHERMDRPFTNNKFTIKKGDVFYILSDGYIDQFGGPKGKKFMTKRFKELLLRIYEKPMDEQSRILEEELLKWRGDIEQIDDIIIIGIRVT